ncbi:MAG: LPS export ABC transporter periplasmic protein LptC [Bacteroidota bacterium]
MDSYQDSAKKSVPASPRSRGLVLLDWGLWMSALLLLLTACENDLAAVQEIVDRDRLAIESAREVQMLYSDSAVVRVRISGPLMLRHVNLKEPFQEFPEGVDVDFFDAYQETQSKLTAKYAIRYEGKNEVTVRDSVVWQSVNGERLETEELVWDDQKHIVFSDRFVKITKPGEVLYGYGFEANEDFTRWQIKALEGRIKVDGLDELRD